jgi:hypothetical protein
MIVLAPLGILATVLFKNFVPLNKIPGFVPKKFVSSVGWLAAVAWLTLLPLPLWSAQAVTLLPLVVTPASAFSQSTLPLGIWAVAVHKSRKLIKKRFRVLIIHAF